MAMAPAATSARPAVTTIALEESAPERPAARAKGTVSPSDIPMTTSRTASVAVKCRSTCGWLCGMGTLPRGRVPLLVGLGGRARADEVAVAVRVVDPRHRGPELVRAHPGQREDGLL